MNARSMHLTPKRTSAAEAATKQAAHGTAEAVPLTGITTYAEKLEPQPQLLVELGLMKLKPWRMRVSSKARTMPAR